MTPVLPQEPIDPIIVAIDRADPADVDRIAGQLVGRVRTLKVGLECFIGGGPDVVSHLKDAGFEIFLDLKLHDIPNQVAGACRQIARMGVSMFTVHTSGGLTMLEQAAVAAREAAREAGRPRPLVLGVTVLTSLDEVSLRDVGVERSVVDQVRVLAGVARDTGLDGIVCSPAEVRDVRQYVPEGFLVVTPGIRSAGSTMTDQRRVGDPGQALHDGANYLVIGRPVTEAPDPAAALDEIREGIANG